MRNVQGIVMLLAIALMLGGCAKKALVPKEEPVAPATPPPVTDTRPVSPSETPVSTPMVPEAPATSATDLTATDATAKAGQQQGLLATVYFDYDSFLLSQDSRDILSRNAELIRKKVAGTVRLEGHCDERGSDEYNLALGEKRAQAALSYLVTLGVPAQRLSTISYGKERPAVPESTEEAWAKNRRVEFVIVK
jgi:peptidoglycan-associated lipoprotein